MNPDRHQNALNQGDRLHWYEIESILGHGGFGITYLALDTNLNHKVAIKEFLPVEFATRSATGEVQPISDQHEEMFEWGKQRFLDEARTLFPFKHPNIVRVLSLFEENHTGYIVMEYVEGVDLADLIRAGEPFSEGELLEIIFPIIEGLALVHEQGYIHRDIKPRNIVIRQDGSPVLIDFGSARQALGEQTRTLTTLVTPGYSPLEQYHGAAGHQGPWTDIYALGATLYASATGKAPADAMQRNAARTDKKPDPYRALVDIVGDKYSRGFLAAIDHAMAFAPGDRPQSLQDWKAILSGEAAIPEATVVNDLIADDVEPPTVHQQNNPPPPEKIPAARKPVGKKTSWLVLLLVFAAAVFFTYPRWLSEPHTPGGTNTTILQDNQTEAAAVAEPADVPGLGDTEDELPPSVGTISTPTNQSPPLANINGRFSSLITYTGNNAGIDGYRYFGEPDNIRITIEQRRSDVIGFIEGERSGRIEGTYSGNEVNFRFNIVDTEGNLNQGVGVWFVSRDGQKMVGKWFLVDQDSGSNFLEGDWQLTRR